MKIGLIGYGAWGKHHAEAILHIPGADLTAIACNSEKTASTARENHKETKIYTNYQDLLKDSNIDAVDIVLPTYLHAEAGIKALESGKHVLLEKPIAGSLAECDRLIDAASRSGKVLTIGHELRLSSQWKELKNIIDEGKIGRPMYALVSIFRFPFRKGANDWRYNRNMVGSWILEELIHYFDLILWFYKETGDPVSVFAYGNSINRNEGLYDNFSSILKFPGGSYAVLTQTLSGFEHHQVIEITGEKGSIRSLWSGVTDRTLNPEFILKLHRKGDEQSKNIPIALPSGELFELEEELKQTVELFKINKALFPAEDARKVVAICIEAEHSLQEKREIPFK